MKHIERHTLVERVGKGLRRSPVVAIVGPRQCGKTTLARQLADGAKHSDYFDLENPVSARRLTNPMLALEPLEGLVVIDEVQLKPELFPILRVLADRQSRRTSFLILGSTSPDLARESAETLAGRVEFVRMSGFSLKDVGVDRMRDVWLRGGLPRSFLAKNEEDSYVWRENFIQTFLDRDMRRFGIDIPSVALHRLWSMLAHYHGQILNASELGRSLSESYMTVKRHIDILTAALMVRQLQPWFENLGKRQVKSPKVYVRDSGLVHALLSVKSFPSLEGHPKLGASWEGFALEQLLGIIGEGDVYFWATHSGAELDLLAFRNGKRFGFEFKYADAPRITKSIRVAQADLKLDHVFVIYPGAQSYPLDRRIDVISINDADRLTAGLM